MKCKTDQKPPDPKYLNSLREIPYLLIGSNIGCLQKFSEYAKLSLVMPSLPPSGWALLL